MAKKMLKSHHLAILALVLALGIATPIVVATLSRDEFARAADETNPATDGEITSTADASTTTGNELTDHTGESTETATSTPGTTADATATVGDFDGLKSALADPEKSTIVLSADIELSEPLTIARDLTLDLKTYKITVAKGVRSALIIRQGDVTISGEEGSSIAVDAGVAIWVYGSKVASDTDFTHLTVASDVSIAASATDDASYGIAINRFGENHNFAYGVKVDFDGKISAYNGITVLGHIRHDDNAPEIHIGDSAVIDAQGEDDSMAIYAAGYGVWTVGAADLTGSSALGAKAGEFTFADTVMTANGSRQDAETANGSIAGSGAVFQIENNSVYAGGIEITIDDGEYTSENGHVFYEYGSVARATSNLEKLTINAGTFTAGPDSSIFSDINAAAVTLNGGAFNREIPADYLGGQKLVAENGVWTLESSPDDNPSGSDSNDDNTDDKQNSDEDGPSQTKPGSSAPGTGVHNITSHISAIATTTTAAVVGALVFIAFVLRRLIRRRPDQVAKSSSAVKKAAKPTQKATAKPAKATTKTTKTAKSTKSSAKSATKKGTKTTKAQKRK